MQTPFSCNVPFFFPFEMAAAHKSVRKLGSATMMPGSFLHNPAAHDAFLPLSPALETHRFGTCSPRVSRFLKHDSFFLSAT